MNHKIKIVKRIDRKEPEPNRLEQPSRNPTREISITIKLWISEFQKNKRATIPSNPS
jgi:hypothetical protein